MTTKITTFTKPDRDFEPFPEFPPRDDMQNWNYLYSRGQTAALALHLGDKETTTAGCEIPVGPTLARHRDIRIPDLMVSRNSRPDVILEHGGYAIDRQGKPPDFVLEVASKTTGVIDYTDKRRRLRTLWRNRVLAIRPNEGRIPRRGSGRGSSGRATISAHRNRVVGRIALSRV